MSQHVNLSLLIFGTIKTIPCRPDFKLSQLDDYMTISDCVEHDQEIFAKVALIKKPFSEFQREVGVVRT